MTTRGKFDGVKPRGMRKAKEETVADFAEAALAKMNEADQWPSTPLRGREDNEHSPNLPLGVAAWFHIKRLLWPDRSADQNVKAHVLELECFPWGRTVIVRLEQGNAGRGEPAVIKVFVRDADGLSKVYEGARGDELDARGHTS